jgi:elongation factor 1-alpha
MNVENKKIQKSHINVVVIGNNTSGKSTLIGNLIYKCDTYNNKYLSEMYKIVTNRIISGESVKGSFKCPWVIDKLKVERDIGITIDFSSWGLEIDKYLLTIINTPGHRNYFKNFIAGASQGDCALFIIASPQGEFEASFSKGGQTRELIILAYTLGIKQMIICINKMDEKTVSWDESRYEDVKSKVSEYLKKFGYNPAKIPFIPISSWYGDNLIERSAKLTWFKGPTLIEALNDITPPDRLKEKPLRIPINKVSKLNNNETVIKGRVESGILRPGMLVTFASSIIQAEVKSVQMHQKQLLDAFPGDNVGFILKNVAVNNIRKGDLCGEANNYSPKQTKSFIAQVIILNHPDKIRVGYTPVVYCHTACGSCKFVELKSRIDRKSGEEIEAQPKFLRVGDTAIVKLVPLKNMSCETFYDYPLLGRLILRDIGKIVAVGVIKAIEAKEAQTTIQNGN